MSQYCGVCSILKKDLQEGGKKNTSTPNEERGYYSSINILGRSDFQRCSHLTQYPSIKYYISYPGGGELAGIPVAGSP